MKKWQFTLIVAGLLISCNSGSETEDQTNDVVETSMGFTVLESGQTGIDFTNSIEETDTFNYFEYQYIYNGAGVAIGDINNDGLEDIYFSGNQVSDKLYLNKDDMRFEDITESAIGPLASIGWHTGVLMQDVNQDGWLDIYVSRSGLDADPELLGNLLFINNGDNTFSEKGEEYGVNIQRPTTQSVFFDMDNDGDLDLYVLNHPYNTSNVDGSPKSVQEVNRLIANGSPFSDNLLENQDGKFVDVTKEAGVNNHAFGLGVGISDLNEDGFADIYVSNDYMAPDHLYMNNGDGTFTDEVLQQMLHISNFSMGNDIADFNNDGLVDIITVDMVSEDHIRSKKNMGGMSTKKFWDVVSAGYHHQYMFNCLQLNNGNGTFSDVAQLAGISKTDWSWAPLFADFDNDGYKDLFITNGYRRDTRDNDFNRGYNPNNIKVETFDDALGLMPETKIANYMFSNNGDLTFSKENVNWGTDQQVNSNGAAYADLDNDGDLDIVLNNFEDVSFILQNDQIGNNYLKIEFEDVSSEGVKVWVDANGETQYQEFRAVRGFMSSVTQQLHFGLGTTKKVDQVRVQWSNGAIQSISDVDINKTITIARSDAKSGSLPDAEKDLYFELTDGPSYQHQEIIVNDFEREVLLPNKMSQLGPFISKGDVNKDGLEDFYVSGARGYSGQLFIATSETSYAIQSGPWNAQKNREEMGSVFFDANGDGWLDLFVTSGSNEYDYRAEQLRDQLYINDGKGSFENKSKEWLPEMITSGQRLTAGDYDNDGDVDLFVGGRQTAGYYPFAPRSYLLKNENGAFIDASPTSPELMGPGLITDCEFVDLDNDGDLDLVVVGEWMAPSFYRNDAGNFTNFTTTFGTQDEVGWWSSLAVEDLNGDGKLDFVFGNVGFNNKFHPEKDHPLEIYTRDFDKNGTYDIVLGKYQDGTCYPVRGRQCSSEQMPFIQNKFPTYGEFAIANLEKIYGQAELDSAMHYSATQFGSMVLLSSGERYEKRILPNEAQLGPINAILIHDFTGDGTLDVLGVGNNYSAEVETVRYDGGRGLLLAGDGQGNFEPIHPRKSGFFCNLDAKDMAMINGQVLVLNNNAKSLTFRLKK